jgi:hypothetical protein
MKPCEDIDVTIFGSGSMTEDDGSGFCLDDGPDQSSSRGLEAQDDMGLPIFLSAIKEWMIEFGSSMIFISLRTDMAWYCNILILLLIKHITPINTCAHTYRHMHVCLNYCCLLTLLLIILT